MKHSAITFPEWLLYLPVIALLVGMAGCSPSEPVTTPAATPRTASRPPALDTLPIDVAITPETLDNSDSTTTNSVPIAEQPQPETKSDKISRAPIYNEKADARADIQAALQRATYDNKRVLVKFGGNWCGWCFKLHDLFHENQEIAALLRGEYELVLVDVRTNEDLLAEYDPKGNHSYPWLTVLNAEGQVLCNQDTDSLELEAEPKHDPAKVKSFLEKWQPERVDAEQALAAGLERARAENKRVLVHIGAPWCGWCRVLDRFLREQHDLIGVDYIDLKIDQDRMADGKTVAARVRSGSTSGGIPWMAILDADGNTLVTSDGPHGNIGYPGEPHEIEHFIVMLNQTRRNLSDEQVATLEHQLQENAAKRKAAAH